MVLRKPWLLGGTSETNFAWIFFQRMSTAVQLCCTSWPSIAWNSCPRRTVCSAFHIRNHCAFYQL